MRPVSEGEEAEEKDLVHLRRIMKRATKNTSRSKNRKREVIDLCSRLISIYTEETLLVQRRAG